MKFQALAWLGLLIASYITRLAPRLARPRGLASDTYYHLLAARAIRENGLRLPQALPGLCFPGPYDYPPLFHWLLALWPEKSRESWERHMSAAWDTASVALIGLWADYALGAHAGFQAAALFAFAPALLSVGTGPRAYHATPRVMAGFLFYGIAFGCGFWLIEGSAAALAAAVIMGAALLLTSKFGAQVMLFMLPAMALILRRHEPVIILLASVLAALILSRGHYWRVAKAHFGHLWLYHQLGSRRTGLIFRKSSWGEIPGLFRACLNNPRAFLRAVLWENCILAAASRNLHLIFLAPALIWGFQTPWEKFWAAWLAASLAAFALTSLRPFLIMGEPERYLEFSLPGQILLIVSVYMGRPAAAWVMISLGVWSALLSAAFIYAFVRIYRPDPVADRQKLELSDFLRSRPSSRILPFFEPPHSLAYRSGKPVFYPCGNFQSWVTPPEEYCRIYEDQGLPNRASLRYIIERYGVDAFVVNALSRVKRGYPDIFGQFGRKVFNNGRYEVYEMGSA